MIGTPETLALVAGVAAVLLGLLFFLLWRRGRPPRPRKPSREEHRPDAAQGLRSALASTRAGLLDRLRRAWSSYPETETRLVGLEELLIIADVGVKVTQQLLDKLRVRMRELGDADALRAALAHEMRAILGHTQPRDLTARPHIILVAGVNGVGKTTSIAKLAHFHISQGRSVLLVAADTFRAAASEQLQLWAERVGADCIRHQGGTDPSAVVYDGLKAALARGIDVVIIDTAGRLHVKTNLIEELKKVSRVISRQVEGAPHEVLLVIDATTGQNALSQARVFKEALPLTGIVLTKLDGTAKGGVVFAVTTEIDVPICYVGFGEAVDDLAPFDADAFVDALLEPSREKESGEIA
jgi:fused signal recognition particle receptor